MSSLSEARSEARHIAALVLLLLAVPASWMLPVVTDAGSAAQATAGMRFPCLSYAPFRMAGTSPNDKGLIIPADAIARDLAQLATVSDCVRLYGVANGLDAVPAIARSLGLRVWLGAWIGSDPQLNRTEIERALQLAHAHADIVERLVVGSETLLRGELAPAALSALLGEVRARSPVPVAYADVWEFWLQHAQTLQPQVDEAVIHILPYWENAPVAAGQAVDHVVDTFGRVRERLSPLPVVIGETGWPAAGRMRAGARPGAAEQQRFLRELMQRQQAQQMPMPMNIIEAFDQPWKASLEGVAGAAWGVFDAQGRARQEAVADRTPQAAWMAAGAVMMALLAWLSAAAGSRSLGWRGTLAAAAAGATLSLLCRMQWQELVLLAPASWAWNVRAAVLLASTAWAATEAAALAMAVAGGGTPSSAAPLLRRLRTAGLLVASAYALLLLTDGRYLDLAWPALAAPVLPLALHTLVAGRAHVTTGVQLGAAALLCVCAVALVLHEGVANSAAVTLALLMVILSACLLPSRRGVERIPAQSA